MLALEVSVSWLSGAVGVLKLVGGGEGRSEWCGGEGGGVVVGIGGCGCGVGTGGSLAELCLLQRSCRLVSTVLRRAAVFKVGGRCFGYLGRGVGRFGGKEWFGVVVVGIGSCSREKRPACSLANARSIASSGSEGLGEGVGVVGVGAGTVAVAIAAAADRFGLWRRRSWRRLSWGRKGNFSTCVATVR